MDEIAKIKLILAQMTVVQRRRYRLYLSGWSYTKIARKEGVSRQSAEKSMKNAQKRAKKRLKWGAKGV